ncbi:MAG: hypothetical protein JST26_11350 [Bacteroidetes bacterium]|nr:hypothetical protein [Bacteroidota bacterium]
MKITTKNYFKAISEVGFDNLPEVLKKSHLVIQEKTNNGNDWGLYDNDPEVKRVFDLAFEKLYEFIDRKDNLAGLDGNPLIERAKKDAAGYKDLPLDKLKMIYRLEQDAELEDGLTPEIKIRKAALEKAIASKEGKPKGNLGMAKNKYSEISQEIKFILRYLDFHDKVLYKNTIGLFIDDLQNAITEKKITKKSPVAKEIMEMQDSALKAFNSMRNAKHIMLRTETIKKLKAIIEKYENAYDDIDEQYAKSKKEKKNLNGLGNTPVNIMSSKDFTNLKFNTLGFEGKWLEFIGDPAPGFTAMVFGMPKMGKSYLCVDFAGYLARNHGKVLYVAKEEKLDATLQKKLKDKDVAHENLFVSDALPSDLSAYDFIFLDSVNKIGLTPKDLEKLKADNKGKSFIYIFQATKGGKFKGNNEFQHDVDVVIEIPEQGKAAQYGRFNQGGELNIFGDSSISEAEELNGVRKSRKNLDDKKKVSNVDTMKKKTANTEDWTEPEHLDKQDHAVLKEINRLYKAKKYKEAMNRAMDADTIIREEIPPEIWKKMGGQLTKTGEDRLRERQGKAGAHSAQESKQKSRLVFNGTVRILKGVIEREWDLELTDAEYIEILEIAEDRSVNFTEAVNEMNPNLNAFLIQMAEALKIWDQANSKSERKSREKFDPRFYENRPDDDNPSYIFSLTSNKLLSEAIEGDFDLIYLVRRELANRGLDSKGKWVGFDEAKRIHRI